MSSDASFYLVCAVLLTLLVLAVLGCVLTIAQYREVHRTCLKGPTTRLMVACSVCLKPTLRHDTTLDMVADDADLRTATLQRVCFDCEDHANGRMLVAGSRAAQDPPTACSEVAP